MICASGTAVWPLSSEHYTGDAPTLGDIAQGLSRTVRFAGQTRSIWTVLTHALVGAQLASDKARIHWLLHDAPEAIVGDVSGTWKCEEHSDNEDDILDLIYESLDPYKGGAPRRTGGGVESAMSKDWVSSSDKQPSWIEKKERELQKLQSKYEATSLRHARTVHAAEVKQIDAAMLAAEAHALGHAQAEKWWPKAEFGDLEKEAFGLTVDMLAAGVPLCYMEHVALARADYTYRVNTALIAAGYEVEAP